ncbi:MAG: hypothetical protein IPG53_23535 [Ignavibacteriales bacterium]|nr:hypothetical protein [Ignavibacteriales bacterium]
MKLQWTADYFRIIPIHLIRGTVIGFRLKEEGRVQLTVYTLTGEKIKELRDESLPQPDIMNHTSQEKDYRAEYISIN